MARRQRRKPKRAQPRFEGPNLRRPWVSPPPVRPPGPPMLPSLKQMCRPILMILSEDHYDTPELRLALADYWGFPREHIKTANVAGKSFFGNFDAALEHLKANKLVIRLRLFWVVVDKRTAKTVSIPPFVTEGRERGPGSVKWPVNLDRLKGNIGTMSKARLHEYYMAAIEFDFDSVKDDIVQTVHNVVMVLDLALAEAERRGLRKKKNEDYIRWPSTKANPGDGSLVLDDLNTVGPLSALGYHVGKNAEGPRQRCNLLSRAFKHDLPRVSGVEEWGENESSARLRKMAESIAAFARNAKRRDRVKLEDAIRQWEHDLEFLRVNYHVGRFDSQWTYPTTAV